MIVLIPVFIFTYPAMQLKKAFNKIKISNFRLNSKNLNEFS